MLRTIDHFIGGSAFASGERQGDVFDPNQGEVQAQVRLGTAADLQKAIDAAKAAQPGWAATNPQRRARVMFKYKELVEKADAKTVDAGHGRAIFKKTCGQCHILFDDGGKIGPNLTGSGRANLDYLFENMVDLMFKNEYDVYVFDTAPTANARRLLGMSKVYGLWVQKMLKSREEAQSLREALSFSKKKEDDPLMNYLVEFRARIAHARELLTDPQKTAFFFVTLPEALPIAVIRRFIDWFSDFGIPVGGVVVNGVIAPEDGETGSEFVRNRVEMQAGYLDEIGERFPGQVRAVIPLSDSDIRGLPALERAGSALFG